MTIRMTIMPWQQLHPYTHVCPKLMRTVKKSIFQSVMEQSWGMWYDMVFTNRLGFALIMSCQHDDNKCWSRLRVDANGSASKCMHQGNGHAAAHHIDPRCQNGQREVLPVLNDAVETKHPNVHGHLLCVHVCVRARTRGRM